MERKGKGDKGKKKMYNLLILTIIISIGMSLINYILTHKSTYPSPITSISDEGERKSQYECGIEPLEEEIGIETRERFYIKFYIIGIIFLIFDIETLLLYPASIIFYKYLNNPTSIYITSNTVNYYTEYIIKGYIVLVIFILFLILGIIYEYNKKIL